MKNETKCKCKSYNGEIGEVESVQVDMGKYFPLGHAKFVCLDRCISEDIITLWENKINTLGCCCGHNGAYTRSVIVDNEADAKRAEALIGSEYEISFWSRVTLESCATIQALKKENEELKLERDKAIEDWRAMLSNCDFCKEAKFFPTKAES